MRLYIILSLWLMIVSNSYSQVITNKPIVFIDPITKTAQLELTNLGNEEQEIELYFKFGYSIVDSMGKPSLKYLDRNEAEPKSSLVPYLRAFPKKVLLKPKESQTVRILLRGFPDDYDDGIYWARYLYKYTGIVKQIDTSLTASSIKARVNMVFEMSYIIMYEKGKVNSGTDITSFRLTSDSSNLNFIFYFNKTGNSPFLGNLAFNIIDNEGNKMYGIDKNFISIFYPSERRFQIPKDTLKSGNYKIILELNNSRDDVPEEYRMDFRPINKHFEFSISSQ